VVVLQIIAVVGVGVNVGIGVSVGVAVGIGVLIGVGIGVAVGVGVFTGPLAILPVTIPSLLNAIIFDSPVPLIVIVGVLLLTPVRREKFRSEKPVIATLGLTLKVVSKAVVLVTYEDPW